MLFDKLCVNGEILIETSSEYINCFIGFFKRSYDYNKIINS